MSAPDPGRGSRRPAAGSAGPRRAADARRLAGVAGGLARFLGLPALWVRAAFLLALPLTLGVIVPVYLLLWLLLPSEGAPAQAASGQEANRGAEQRIDAR